MNSAAKLRTRGIAALGATALIATSFGPAAFAAWDAAPQGGVPTQSPLGIGLVDTKPGPNDPGTQGATLIHAGQDNQALGDIRLVIPNSFRKGDVIDVRLLDRSATEESNGKVNAGPATKLELAANPTASVSEAKAANTEVNDLNNAAGSVAGNNTENREGAANYQVTAGKVAPGQTPGFDVARVASTGSNYLDTVRLTVNTNPSTGDPDAKWVLTLSDLKVNLGAEVTPGEVRAVPFAYNGDNNNLVAAPDVFSGNIEAQANITNSTRQTNREIGIYTVPAYVAPVTIAMANGNIQADGSAQNVGDVTITETQTYSLPTGTYRLEFDGARIANPDTRNIKISVANGGTDETATIGSIAPGQEYIEFSIGAGDDGKKATYTISGLMLATTTPGTISMSIGGNSVTDVWYAPAGDSNALGSRLAASDRFVAQGGLTAAPEQVLDTTTNTSKATLAPSFAETLVPGPYTVTNVPASNGSVAITSDNGTNINTTTGVSDADSLKIGNGTQTLATRAQVLTNTAYDGGAAGVTNLSPAELALFPATTTGDTTYTLAWNSSDKRFEIRDGSGDALFQSDNDSTQNYGAPITLTGATGVGSITLNATQTGTFTVTTTETTPAGSTLTDANGKVWTSGTELPALADAAVTFTNGADTVTLNPSSGEQLDAGTFVTNNTTGRAAYNTVTLNFAAPISGTAVYESTDARTFTKVSGATAAPASFTSSTDVVPGDIVIQPSTPETGEPAVNQDDILLPEDMFIDAGIASSPYARIGGNNRYETARKIMAERAGGRTAAQQNVIIASGENFPDALSASYLSQRMNASILLTQKGRIPADTLEGLRDHQVEKVFIIGGDQAVSKAVEDQLRGLKGYIRDGGQLKEGTENLQVQRLGGVSRYTTNQLVNMYGAAWGGNNTIGRTVYKYGESQKYTAIIARGDNFADAMTSGVLTAGVGGAAGSSSLPLILTPPTSLETAAIAQIDNLDVQHAIMVGSDNALSTAVQTGIQDKGVSVQRLEGKDRYFTAAAVAEYAMRNAQASTLNEYPGLGFIAYDSANRPVSGPAGDADAYLATGIKFADALTAGPWIGRNSNVLNLTAGANDLSDGTKDFLSKRAADVDRVTAVGLGQAVSNGVLAEANKLASAK